MRSRQLETSLTEFFGAASAYLRAEVAAGAEVPFELGAQAGRRGGPGTPLYTYRALTGVFISERDAALKRLPGHAELAKLLERFEGLDRYLASVGGDAARAKGRARVRASVKALLEEAFDEQTDFELRPERLQATLDRLQNASLASAGEISIVATLHGVTIASSELALTKGLLIAQCDALDEVPDDAIAPPDGDLAESHLIVSYTVEQDDVSDALRGARAVLKDLLSALRLFGDGRVTLGALAWVRVGAGPWSPLALGAGGRPYGMLIVTAEQEDELRAFCNLVSRRAPHDNDLAWALRRFELGCEREIAYEALTDNLLSLRALLEPEGAASGQLAGRLAALCATPEQRGALTERMTRAIALERSLIAGTAKKNAASQALVDDVANHLRSLLRDVICGHLDPDLAVIADEMLEPDELLHSDEPAEPSGEQTAERAGAEPADDYALRTGEQPAFADGLADAQLEQASFAGADREAGADLELDAEADLELVLARALDPEPDLDPELGDLQLLATTPQDAELALADVSVPEVEPGVVAVAREQSLALESDAVAALDAVDAAAPLR